MNNVNNIDNENICKNIYKKYNKPYKSIYSWNSYIKVARNNGFGGNVEEYFK